MQAVAFPLEIDNLSSPPPDRAESSDSPADPAPRFTYQEAEASAYPGANPRVPLGQAGETPSPAEPADVPRAEPQVPQPVTWTGTLLAPDAVFSARREAARFGIGLGLAAVYGLALGARDGRAAFLTHAAGVPAALLVAFGVGIPALYIFLALLDAPVVPSAIASAATRATATAGLVLAGLAPAAALFVVTSDRNGAAALAAAVGLAVGGAFGLGSVVSDLRQSIVASGWPVRVLSNVVFGVFGLFAVVVTLRVWMSLLPVLGGAR